MKELAPWLRKEHLDPISLEVLSSNSLFDNNRQETLQYMSKDC